MIDKDIKRKIDTKEEVSSTELFQYFNNSPAPIEKGLFKQIRQRRREKTHSDTQQYLLDNFDAVMESISTLELRNFFRSFSRLSHKKELFEKLSQNTPRLVELFNNQYGEDLRLAFDCILKNEREAHAFFENNFAEYYSATNSYEFDIQSYFRTILPSKQIGPLILQGLCNAAVEQNIRNEDIPFFLQEYIYMQTSNERVLWNEINTPLSSISETSKSKIQETITPETALYLIQSTSQPLYVHRLLQSIGLETPEITGHLDTHLDDIVHEISNNSSDSLTIKMVIQELLNHENVNPSDIEYSAQGGFGKVFKIGDKVLKYGRRAHNPELPYNSELFLQPLLRQSLSGTDFIEIYEQVEVGGSREDMYQLYKALRDQGLIWTDIKPGNMGRLLKPNTIHFNGIDSVNHRAVGFKEDRKIPIAQPGDYVLIDLDYVFPEGSNIEIPAEGTAMNNFREFSARYKREKEAEQNQGHTITKKKSYSLDEI